MRTNISINQNVLFTSKASLIYMCELFNVNDLLTLSQPD